jgi:lysozyme
MMSQEMLTRLKQSLIKHEGYSKNLYQDSLGIDTIGIGYAIGRRGLSDEWINQQFLDDVTYFYNQWETFPWFKDLNEDRQIVLIDFSFMGWQKVLEFKDMLTKLAIHDYKGAADAMLNSKWSEQVKGRAKDLADGMRSGVYSL